MRSDENIITIVISDKMNNDELETAIKYISNVIQTHNKYKSCYLWEENFHYASYMRKRGIEDFYKFNPDIIIKKDNDEIKVNLFYDESCRKVYYKLRVYKNGEKKNITILKKILTELENKYNNN